MRRSPLRQLTAFVLLLSYAGIAIGQAQSAGPPKIRAQAVDFTVQLFLEATGEFSPNIFTLGEFGVWNFNAQWKDKHGGKFSGFLVRVKLVTHGERDVFAEGRQAQIIFRDRKTRKILRSWNISDVYIDDSGASWRALFVSELDCKVMQVQLLSGTTNITRDLAFACGE